MNALLFAHVGIRAALLTFALIGLAQPSRRSRLLVFVVAIAVVEAGWRLFAGVSASEGWEPLSVFSLRALTDLLLTTALLAAHRRKPRSLVAREAEALRRAQTAGELAAAASIAHRMSRLVEEDSPNGDVGALVHDLRALTTSPGEPAANESRLADATLARIGRELREITPATVAVRLDFAEDLGPLLVEGRCLRDAMHRVGRNALAAMTTGGTLSIRASVNKIGDHNLLGLQRGHWMRVEIADSGCGMSPTELARCQDPFYTTRETAAGLGLSAVRAFTARVGGALEVDSHPGAGTRVTLWLPAAAPNERRSRVPDAIASALTVAR